MRSKDSLISVFHPHLNADDELTLFIRTHQDIDGILCDIIDEALIEKHHLEVNRIPFPLKVELAFALGSLTRWTRAPLLKFNSLRNELAHNPATKLTEKDAHDFYNVFEGEDAHAIIKYGFEELRAEEDVFKRPDTNAVCKRVYFAGASTRRTPVASSVIRNNSRVD